jgi:SAM-dependent methyltransferase
MTNPFETTAEFYDLLYGEKEYQAEAAYVAEHITRRLPGCRRILELGCGSGGHAAHLAGWGFDVVGVDSSPAMLGLAEARRSTLPTEAAARLRLVEADVRAVDIAGGFDAVVSLFHVVSYQTSDQDLLSMFRRAAAHLEPGGLFLFDYWHAPAVLAIGPSERVKDVETAAMRLRRVARPVLDPAQRIVDVTYSTRIHSVATGANVDREEQHRMRCFFTSEIEAVAAAAGLAVDAHHAWLEAAPPSERTWAAFTVAVRPG